MSLFLGYYIVGAASRQEALRQRGLLLWSRRRPSLLRRLLNEWLLGIYWVERDRAEGEARAPRQHPEEQVALPRTR